MSSMESAGWRSRGNDRYWFDGAAAGVRRQCLAGPQFDEYEGALGERGGQSVGEADGSSEMVDPVLRVGGLGGGDPCAGQIRDVADLRRPKRDGANDVEEFREHRVE